MSEVQEVVGRVTLDDRMSGKMSRLQGNLNKLSSYGGRAMGNLDRNLGRIAVVGAGLALYGLKRNIQAAADFQDALAQVEKTLNKTSKTPANLAGIKNGLLDLSKRLPMTAVELADIARQAGQLGIESAPEMMAFTETVAKLARVTDITASFAAENLGKIRTMFKFTAADTTHFGNVLVALENSAASSVTEIINITRRFAAAGQQAGLSADQVAAFASTIASLGVNPEAAGSALSRIFNRTAIEIANASSKAKQFAKFMGLSFSELKASYLKSPEQFFVNFFKKVNQVFTKGTAAQKLELKARLKDMGFNNVRDINAIQQLSAGTDELSKQLSTAKNASHELDESAASRFKSFASQWIIFKNNVTSTMISIGDEIMPAILPAFQKVTGWMNNNKELFKQFGRDVASGISGLVDMLTPENLDKAVGAMKSIAGYAKTFIDAFLNMPAPIRNILLGLYAGNKLTGGVVADVTGDLLGGALKQLLGRGSPANPMFVVPMGAGLGAGAGGAGAAAGGIGLGGVVASGAVVAAAAIAAYQYTLDQNNKQAGANVNSAEYLAAHGTDAEIRAAIERMSRIPQELQGIQSVLYDLNYQGVKTHNEDLIAYLQSKLPRTVRDDTYTKPLDPKNVANAVEGFANKAILIWNGIMNKGEKQNELIRGLPSALRRPPTKINTTAKTNVTINVKVDGQQVATAVYNATASAPTTYDDSGHYHMG